MENAHTAILPAHQRGRSQPLHAQVFSAAAMPAHARAARETVRTHILDTDVLGTRGRQPWDSTTSVPETLLAPAGGSTGIIGPASKPAASSKPRGGRNNNGDGPGVGKNNNAGGGWAKSTAAPGPRELEQSLQESTRAAMEATRRRREKVLVGRARDAAEGIENTGKRGVYIPPSTRTEMVQSRRRDRIALERSVGKEELELREAVAAKRRERAERAGPKRDKSSWIRVTRHTGTWAYSAVERSEVWSCCASAVHGSDGCDVSYKNPDAWDLTSMP